MGVFPEFVNLICSFIVIYSNKWYYMPPLWWVWASGLDRVQGYFTLLLLWNIGAAGWACYALLAFRRSFIRKAVMLLAASAADSSRRNVLLLAAGLAMSMTGTTMVITASALAGKFLASDQRLSTLPVAMQFVLTMIATVPASFLMQRLGRRFGFILGQVTGAASALVSAYAIYIGSFPLFVISSGLFGVHNAIWQYYRFAAAETASPEFKARAISLVMSGGIVAALIGPQLAKYMVDAMGPVPFVGIYVTIAAIALMTIGVLAPLRIPMPTAAERAKGGRPLSVIARQPAFIVAVLSAMMGYGVMTLVMTATPLAMLACDHSFGDAAFVIQWHVLGMFVPSFFTGDLIRRFGALRVIAVGGLALLGCVAFNLAGIEMWNFWVALVLLGIGWNFMFIGGTTLLTDTYLPEEKAKIQSFNDFMVFGMVALASLSSGFLQQTIGWQAVNTGIVPLVALALCGTLWLAMRRRRDLA